MTERLEETKKPLEREGVIFLITHDRLFLTELCVKEGSGYYGRYRIPGGKSEDGESPAQTVFREAFEETGIVVKNIIFLDSFEDHTLNNNLVKLHAFLIDDYAGEPVENEPEKGRLFWLDKNDALSKLKLVSSRHVLTKAIEAIETKLSMDL